MATACLLKLNLKIDDRDVNVNNSLLKNILRLKQRIIIAVRLKSRQATLGYIFDIIAYQAIILIDI